MFSIEMFTELLGWSTVINMAILIASTLMLIFSQSTISTLHSKLFNLNKADLPSAYFHYLANYKIAIFIFNLVPYLALKLMT